MEGRVEAAVTAFKAAASFIFGESVKVVAKEGTKVLLTTAAKAAAQAVVRAALADAAMRALSPRGRLADPGKQTRFEANPYAPRGVVFGRTGLAGHPVMATSHGTPDKWRNAYLTYIVALSCFGPVQAVESLKIEGETQSFTSNKAVGGSYSGRLYHEYRLGDWVQTAIGFTGAESSNRQIAGWNANCKGSGIAHAALTYNYDPNVYSGGVPAPLWTIQGSTLCWRPDTNAVGYSEYAADIVYTLFRGLTNPITGVKIGAGLDPDLAIDRTSLSAFRAACVTNNWKVGGVYYISEDNLIQVIRAILQACGAEIADINGKVGVVFEGPAVPVLTLTEKHLTGHPTEIPGPDRQSFYTSAIPKCRREDEGWDLKEVPEVVKASYEAELGYPQTLSPEYDWTSNVAQARQVAAYELLARRQPVYEMPCKPFLEGLSPGTRVALDLPEYGISVPCARVVSNGVKLKDGGPITFRVDPQDIHTWALGHTDTTSPPDVITQIPAVQIPAPETADWTATATLITEGSTSLPIIKVVGSPGPEVVAEAQIQIKPSASGTWVDTVTLTRGALAAEFRGITPNTTYNLRVQYKSSGGAVSSWVSLADVTTGNLVAGSAASVPYLGVTGSPATLQNRLRNSTFLMGAAAWTVNQAHLYTTAGNDNVCYYAGGSYRLAYQAVPVNPGESWSYAGELYADSTQHIRLYGQWIGPAPTYTSLGFATVLNKTVSWPAWDRAVANNNIAPAGAAFLWLKADNSGDETNPVGYAGARRIMLVKGPVCPAWTDTGELNPIITKLDGVQDGATKNNVFTQSTAPTGTVSPGDIWKKTEAGVVVAHYLRDSSNTAWELTADITAKVVRELSVSTSTILVECNYLGEPLSGQLNKYVNATYKEGGVDKSSSTTWSVSAATATVSVNASGLVTISGISNSCDLIITGDYTGDVKTQTVKLIKNVAAPPQTGGSGPDPVFDTSFNEVSTTSHTVISDEMTVQTGAAGTLTFSANLGFGATLSGTAYVGCYSKWEYKLASGGSWADVAAQELSDTSAYFNHIEFEGTEGAISCNPTKTGLAANTNYVVRLSVARASSSPSGNLYFYGTALCQGS